MKTSLYRHFDKHGTLLYVGVSLNALVRLGQHADHSKWFESISRMTIEQFDTREDALKAEREAIVNEKPLHNIVHAPKGQAAPPIAKLSADSKRNLIDRVVAFRPMYTVKEAAEELRMSTVILSRLIRTDQIGYVTRRTQSGKEVIYITGWQIIEFIENLVNEHATDR